MTVDCFHHVTNAKATFTLSMGPFVLVTELSFFQLSFRGASFTFYQII